MGPREQRRRRLARHANRGYAAAVGGALLTSLSILAGDKAHAARTSPHQGIAPAVLTAIAGKVSGVLLERLA